MAVYVDNMRARYGRMIMCHMIADTEDELLDMAAQIGVARRWHQYPGTWKSHFDICLSKRRQAVAAGACEVSQEALVRMTVARRRENRSTAGEPGAR